MPNNMKLVVVADTGTLKIFEAKGLKITRTVETLDLDKLIDHPDRQEKHQGQHGGAGNTSHFFDPHTAPKEIERHNAVQLIATILDKLVQDNHDYKEVIMVADPKTLGQIRQSLTNRVKQIVTKELSKDLTHQTTAKIEEIVFA